MNILIINTRLTYQGWSEGKLNFTFMQTRKDVLCRARGCRRRNVHRASDHDKSKFLSLSLMLYIT